MFSAIERGEIDDSLVPFEDSKNHLYGYKNRSGRIVIRSIFAVALNFNQHGIADVLLDTKNKPNRIWVKIDKLGKILTYSYFFDNGPDYFVGGLSRFVEKDEIGFIDYKARKVVSAEFDWASPFHFDLPVAIVCKGCKSDGLGEHPEIEGGKWGVIDSRGKIIVPLEYDSQYIAKSHNPDETITFLKGKKLYQVFQMQNGDYKTADYRTNFLN